MKNRTVIILLLAMVMMAVAVTGCGIFKNSYPSKPVTIVVPWAKGGGTDICVNTIAPYAEKLLGTKINISNVEGGGSEVGLRQVARSNPDGYNIVAFNSASVTLTLMREVSYDPLRDLEPVCRIVSDPRLLVVRAGDKRFNAAADFIKYARETPAGLTIATAGAGSTGHYSVLIINKEAGIKTKPVHFGSGGEAKAALLGAQVDAAAQTYGEISDDVKEGKFKVLAVATDNRLPELPSVPTFKELGINLVIYSNRGFAVPKGTPQAVVNRLAEVFSLASEDPEYLREMEGLGMPVNYLGSVDYGELIQSEIKDYGQAIKELLR